MTRTCKHIILVTIHLYYNGIAVCTDVSDMATCYDEESLTERQENELQALKAIYFDVKDLRENDTWEVIMLYVSHTTIRRYIYTTTMLSKH